MFRRIDCRKYWKWKRQQESKSKKVKRKVIKRKRKESVTDCIENVVQNVASKEKAEVVLKVSHPKRKEKKKPPWLLVRQPIKRVPLADLLLKSIKPSVEIREYFHNPRHTACLQITSLDIDFVPEVTETAASLQSQTHVVDHFKARRKCRLSGRRKTKDDENEKRKQMRKKSWRTESEEEESDCTSICSFDSEICLAGLKLTSKDKKEIKKYQSQPQEDSNKEEEQ